MVGAIPDRPRPPGQDRMSDVPAGESPSPTSNILHRPLHPGSAPLQHTMAHAVGWPALEKVGLQDVSATHAARLRRRHQNLGGPPRRNLRGVIAKTQALPDQDDVKEHVRLALGCREQLLHEVLGVVERHESVFDPGREVPRQPLLLPPRGDVVSDVASVDVYPCLLILPHPIGKGQRMRQHHTRRHTLRLHVWLRVVRATIGS
mmetsp:Transcript_78301/g.224398  ORF Transcript_78301/g.224398 Transcript_78301/m.224398 type:complete len:204 (-) Transcript_78301:297-908(-)